MSTFRLSLLPARHGDCILIEYGEHPPWHRVLIDGGTDPTWKSLRPTLEAITPAERKFELMVITHVDADHIGGSLKVFDPGVPQLELADIWFNGYRHLQPVQAFGPVQGEKLTTLLLPRMAQWNKAFSGNAVVVPSAGGLPVRKLPGGMKLTLLSPTPDKLLKLLPKWEAACKKAGLEPGVPDTPEPSPMGLQPMGAIDVEQLADLPFKEDTAEPNGSSIAFLAEYGGKSVLFGADAHPSVLEASIARLPGGEVTVDAFKLAHHGSKHNTSPALLQKVKTRRYLFSTNGAQFYHPDRETIARIVLPKKQSELWFNYRSQYTEIWDDDDLRTEWLYKSFFAIDDDSGITLDL